MKCLTLAQFLYHMVNHSMKKLLGENFFHVNVYTFRESKQKYTFRESKQKCTSTSIDKKTKIKVIKPFLFLNTKIVNRSKKIIGFNPFLFNLLILKYLTLFCTFVFALFSLHFFLFFFFNGTHTFYCLHYALGIILSVLFKKIQNKKYFKNFNHFQTFMIGQKLFILFFTFLGLKVDCFIYQCMQTNLNPY